jgi:hypothetical protein
MGPSPLACKIANMIVRSSDWGISTSCDERQQLGDLFASYGRIGFLLSYGFIIKDTRHGSLA